MTDQRLIAEAAKEFANSDFGKHFITKLSLTYNGLHHDAEKAETVEAKAMKVERAAGVKVAIDFISERIALLDNGHFDNKE